MYLVTVQSGVQSATRQFYLRNFTKELVTEMWRELKAKRATEISEAESYHIPSGGIKEGGSLSAVQELRPPGSWIYTETIW